MGDPDDVQHRLDQLYERLRSELLSTFTPPSDQGTMALPVITTKDTTATAPAPVVGEGRGLTYSRFVPFAAGFAALVDTESHVRAHLSAVADQDDDPDTRSEDVQIEHRAQGAGTLIVGFLPNAVPTAPYLQPGYDAFAAVDPALLREVLGG